MDKTIIVIIGILIGSCFVIASTEVEFGFSGDNETQFSYQFEKVEGVVYAGGSTGGSGGGASYPDLQAAAGITGNVTSQFKFVGNTTIIIPQNTKMWYKFYLVNQELEDRNYTVFLSEHTDKKLYELTNISPSNMILLSLSKAQSYPSNTQSFKTKIYGKLPVGNYSLVIGASSASATRYNTINVQIVEAEFFERNGLLIALIGGILTVAGIIVVTL